MKRLLGIEITDKEFDYFMCEQAKGKELKIVDNKIVAEYHQQTEKEKLEQERREILRWFEEYDNQVKQYNRCKRLGVEFDRDIGELDNQATEKQLRLREIKNELEPKQVEDEQNL